MASETPAWDAWLYEIERLRPEILRDPVASAVVHLAGNVFTELATEINRLRAELDEQAPGHPLVLHCVSRATQEAMAVSLGEEPGTILRATDSMESWELGPDRVWRPR